METQVCNVVIDDRNDDALSSYWRRNDLQQTPRQPMENRACKAFRPSVAWWLSPSIAGDVADVFAAETLLNGFVLCPDNGSNRRSTKRSQKNE